MNRIFYDGQATLGAGGNGEAQAFNLIAWCAEETKDLAQRDKDFFYMGAGNLFYALKKAPSLPGEQAIK